MTRLLDWNNLSEKDKKHISAIANMCFVAGSIVLSTKRIKELVREQKGRSVLLGVLKDKEIPGLEDSPHFEPLRLETVKSAVKGLKNVNILQYFHRDAKYIIKELSPREVVFINGSWPGQIHYRSEYWKAIEAGSEVSLKSPFVNEIEAKAYEKRYSTVERNYTGKYSETELLKIAKEVAAQSWDWIGRTGAVLARKGKVLMTAYNRVLPYQANQLHNGSIRERLFIPAQEMLETHLTNHAECELLEKVRRRGISLVDAELFINLFPCPFCAKVLARTDLSGIVYSQDHNLGNDIGYTILEAYGKKIRRVVI